MMFNRLLIQKLNDVHGPLQHHTPCIRKFIEENKCICTIGMLEIELVYFIVIYSFQCDEHLHYMYKI